MDERVELTVSEEDAGRRLDALLAAMLPERSRSSLQKQIEEGSVLLNGSPSDKNARPRAGDRITVLTPPPEVLSVLPEDIPLDIVYEDGELLVVNKPKGMVVHPAAGNEDGTLVNALLFHCGSSLSGINGVMRPGIVHRIDKNTSGLLIVAKTDRAHQGLAAQIQAHSFLREYEAVVYGAVKADSGTVDLPIGRSQQDRKKMCVTEKGSRKAITHYSVLERFSGFTHIRCRLETGRTHQIRVHMAAVGYPVAGDEVYGPRKVIERLHGQCLHAKTIGFVHPVTGEQMFFDSELPEYFRAFLKSIKR